MTIKFSVAELELLRNGILIWIGDIEDAQDAQQGVLKEEQVYRLHHLRAVLRKIEMKIADKKKEKGQFQMKFDPLACFTILNCWRDEEEEFVIRALRSIMRKFAYFEQKPFQLYVS